ncbi:hypothetical protein [Acidiphilium sp.]|uniref:hypothetical protein n=1 Tax=Acidiphilium sp. TaxID=527 RepID=UPI003D05AE1A
MKLAPGVVVYDRGQAERVARRGATLLSPSGFAVYGGCAWWAAIVADLDVVSLLNCGDGAGRAVEAMRLGLRGVVLLRAVPNFAAVAEIAAACGALLLDTAPPALDLAERGADRRLAAWMDTGRA